jgi:putative endopeptidase
MAMSFAAAGIRRYARLILVVLATGTVSAQEPRSSGIDPAALDPTCKPCEDFWRYANGGWLRDHPIPADRSTWGSFTVAAMVNRERLRTLLEAAAADRTAPAGSGSRKMGDLYASCLATDAIDRRGVSPLQPDFDRIERIASREDLLSALIEFQRVARPFTETNGAVVGPFRVTTGPDAKNPDRMVVQIVERDRPGRTGTSILSLPDRDYYFKEDEASRRVRAEFAAHTARLLALAGTPASAAEAEARTVVGFERALAESVMPLAEKRDPDKTYNLVTLDQLRALAPAFDWARLLRELGLPADAPNVVSEPQLLRRVNEQLLNVPLTEWKTWLRWRTIKLAAPYLATAIAAEDFAFDRGVLAGVREPLPRWETCANLVDRDLSDALGEAYVQRYFPPAARTRMLVMVENLRAAFREQLQQSWMQPQTKERAIAKLNALRVEVGYPSTWRSYADVAIDRGRFFENVRAAWTHGQRLELGKVGKPVDRTTWSMNAPTVNAYSNPGMVVVVFPAGILQPPFFDAGADDAVNYGAIGAVIGHEMGHQFDDGGSKYDATGRLNNWWTPEDRSTFDTRAACVQQQFDTLEVGEGLHHNGKQVLGEALGDLIGATAAYRAYRRSLEGQPEPAPIDGFTADQRFFIAFARVWGTDYRPAARVLQINTNNHPVSQFRAIGTLQNMPEFHKAFGCVAGDAMVRPTAQQCRIW